MFLENLLNILRWDLRDGVHWWNHKSRLGSDRLPNRVRGTVYPMLLIAISAVAFIKIDNSRPISFPIYTEENAAVAHKMRLVADHRAKLERSKCERQ